MAKRPFLVLSDRECVPLEGPYRIERIRGAWYVLGHHQAIACKSPHHARISLERLMLEHDAHGLVAEALEGLPDGYEVIAQRD